MMAGITGPDELTQPIHYEVIKSVNGIEIANLKIITQYEFHAK